jgi:glycosyltransferase involved in cell wall biosynthesis
MKILHLWSLYHEELKYHIHYLSKEFLLQAHQVSLVSSTSVRKAWRPYVKRKILEAGVENHEGMIVYRLPAWNFSDKPIPYLLHRYFNILKQEQADVIHVFSLTSVFNYIGLMLLTWVYPKRFVIVANDHSNPLRVSTSSIGNLYYKLNIFLFQRFGRQIKRVYVPNDGTKHLIQERFHLSDDVVKIMPLGYDGSTFYHDPSKRNQSAKLIIGFAGKVDRDKRVDVLLQAVSECVKQGLEISCIVAGVQSDSDYVREFQDFSTKHKLEVKFRPMLSSEALAELYNYVDVAIFPGSISITTVEATGCGSPVIVYDSIPGLEDRVENGRGYLFKEFSELVTLIQKVYRLKQQSAIQHADIARASQKYTWKELAQAYIKDYMTLLRELRQEEPQFPESKQIIETKKG